MSVRVLLLVAILTSVSFAACGGRDSATTVSPDATPQEIAAVAGIRDLHSGNINAGLIVTKLAKNESIVLGFTGSFEGLGEGEQSQFHVAASSQGRWSSRTIDLNSQLTVRPEGAVLDYGPSGREEAYELLPKTFENLRAEVGRAQEAGGGGDASACLDAAGEFDLAELIRDPEIEGRREESDRTKVVLVTGDLNIPRLHYLLLRLARDPDCGAQMDALGLPTADEMAGARVDFKKGFGPKLTVAVDRHGLLRSLTTRFECARLNGEKFELELNFGLSEVNQEIEISGPVEGAPLSKLLQRLGTTQEAILGGSSEETVIALLQGLGDAMAGRLP